MEKILIGKSEENKPAYNVYSFNYPVSEKRGQSWRNHCSCSSRDEALWIAEQLIRCDDVARVEIRLQRYDFIARAVTERAIKTFDKMAHIDRRFLRFLKFFPINK